MQPLKALEIGVMFWAGQDPAETLREVKSLGVRCGQLGIPGDLELDAAMTATWKRALADEEFRVVTVFAAYTGESYADIPAVQRTVGFIPRVTRVQREQRTYEVSDFAATLGAPGIATHIGCVPDDPADSDYVAVRDLVRRVCDDAAEWNQTFALETGQESARVLLEFIQDVDRPNLRDQLRPRQYDPVRDRGPDRGARRARPAGHLRARERWKPAPEGCSGRSRREQPFGKGAVGPDRFIDKLKHIGYDGTLNVEREIEDQKQRLEDIRDAVATLERLR